MSRVESSAGLVTESHPNASDSARVLDSADVDPTASIGHGTTVWHLAQVRERAVVGTDCIIGRGVYIDAGVRIGDRCKLQNHALLYAPAVLADGVFIGPAAMLTNDGHPRAVDPAGRPKRPGDWTPVGVHICEGAAIGAGAVVLGGVTVGAWASVGAGAVVTKDVPAHALVIGVPARQAGWVGHAGFPLERDDEGWRCPRTDRRYTMSDGRLRSRP